MIIASYTYHALWARVKEKNAKNHRGKLMSEVNSVVI